MSQSKRSKSVYDWAIEDSPRVRVRGRTKAQLRDDRLAVQEAVWQAVRAMMEDGCLHGCAEHIDFEDGCKRCEWVNDKLARGEF